MFNFEKLEVWQKTKDLVNDVFLTTKNFPTEEKFGLAKHLRKTAISILSNIAEGCSRKSRTEFQRFIEIALGSVYEFVTQTIIAKEANMLPEDKYPEWYNKSESIAQMLSALSNSLR